MQILVHTDNHTKGSENFHELIKGVVTDHVGYRASQITRIEVFLTDENANKSGVADKRCLLEARLENLKPVVVKNHADNFLMAAQGAAEKLDRAIETVIGRLNTKSAQPMPEEESDPEDVTYES